MKPLQLLSGCFVIAAALPPLFAQATSREGAMEKIALVAVGNPKAWSAAECVVASSSERIKSAPHTWKWSVHVDHFAGEARYPIGWPRISHSIGEGPLRDWTGWDFFRVSVFVETSRATLPGVPAGLGLLTPDRASGYNRTLAELKKDQWVDVTIPLSQIPRHHDVRQLQFHVGESNYQHGDRIDFHLNDLALLRYAEPTVFDLAAENSVLFSDVTRVPVRFQLLGVKPAERTPVECELRRDGKTAARVSIDASRGVQRVVLDLGRQKLAPGTYQLHASAGGRSQSATASVRVVESPWR